MRDLTTIEQELAASEAQVPHLRPGCEKRIIWAGDSAVQTEFSVVYIHGFSATGEELRPLPDLVARGLDANLFFTRLDGHGQDSEAMGCATLEAWQADVSEAIEVAQTIGRKVVIMGCSTGCTLATLALGQGAQAMAVIHVSPNFGLRNKGVQFLLDLPASRHWAKYVAGNARSFTPISDAHKAYWTVEYPTAAVHVMADAVEAAWQVDLAVISTPALFCYNLDDQVVHPSNIKKVMSAWGGAKQSIVLVQTPEDDEMGHVMAGDVFSPNQTAPLAAQILSWLQGLPDA